MGACTYTIHSIRGDIKLIMSNSLQPWHLLQNELLVCVSYVISGCHGCIIVLTESICIVVGQIAVVCLYVW